jgi:hypothetical protein
MTYRAIATNGNYLNLVMPNTGLYDQNFHQFDHDLRLSWVLSGNGMADAKLSYLSRSHGTYTQRDYSGFASGVGVNWAVSGKTSVRAAYAHELGVYATSYSNYSATDQINLGANWQMSPKAALRFSQAWSRADYLGSSTPAPSTQRRDTTRDTSLSLVWTPLQQITLDATLQKQARNSSLSNLNYDTDLANLTIQLIY